VQLVDHATDQQVVPERAAAEHEDLPAGSAGVRDDDLLDGVVEP
jgi:hypothetical protein